MVNTRSSTLTTRSGLSLVYNSIQKKSKRIPILETNKTTEKKITEGKRRKTVEHKTAVNKNTTEEIIKTEEKIIKTEEKRNKTEEKIIKTEEKRNKTEEKKLENAPIDFDDASACWMANKKRLGNGMYVYLCGKSLKNKTCRNACVDKIGFYSGCNMHYMWEEKEHHGV